MYQLHGAWMALFEIDTGDAAVIHLTEELAEISTALMPNPGIRNETWHVASFYYAIREVDILAKAHLGESSKLEIHIATNAHVERSGIELVELGLSASDATSGEKRSHRIADGFLDRRERGMCSIRPAKCHKCRIYSGQWTL